MLIVMHYHNEEDSSINSNHTCACIAFYAPAMLFTRPASENTASRQCDNSAPSAWRQHCIVAVLIHGAVPRCAMSLRCKLRELQNESLPFVKITA